jgi:hypothetical protein
MTFSEELRAEAGTNTLDRFIDWAKTLMKAGTKLCPTKMKKGRHAAPLHLSQ